MVFGEDFWADRRFRWYSFFLFYIISHFRIHKDITVIYLQEIRISSDGSPSAKEGEFYI